MVAVGELRCGGHAMFACFEAADATSSYLQLPSHPVQRAPRFVPSTFGDHAQHGCFVTTTLAIPWWLSGYGPARPRRESRVTLRRRSTRGEHVYLRT